MYEKEWLACYSNVLICCVSFPESGDLVLLNTWTLCFIHKCFMWYFNFQSSIPNFGWKLIKSHTHLYRSASFMPLLSQEFFSILKHAWERYDRCVFGAGTPGWCFRAVLTRVSSSIMLCCSRTCSLRNSISWSSVAWSRSFRDLSFFRGGWEVIFSFWVQQNSIKKTGVETIFTNNN